MVCEARVTKETSLETLAVVEDQVRKSLLTRCVFSPKHALPGTSPSRCLHTNQVVTEKALLGICHTSIAGMKMANAEYKCHRAAGVCLR